MRGNADSLQELALVVEKWVINANSALISKTEENPNPPNLYRLQKPLAEGDSPIVIVRDGEV